MPLPFQCPKCRMKLAVAEEHQGKQVRCPKCAAVLKVPKAAAPVVPPASRVIPPSDVPKVKTPNKPATATTNVKPQAEKKLPARRDAASPRQVKDDQPKQNKTRTWLIAGVAAGCGSLVLCMGLGGGLLYLMADRARQEERSQKVEDRAHPEERNQKVEDRARQEERNQKVEISAKAIEKPNEARPEPAVQLPPIEPLAKVSEGPVPAQLDPAALRKVKQATVYLRVNLPNGDAAEGSGFLCSAPGIVVTNAHVLGMLRSDSVPPTRVEVVLHSGERDEKKTTATVLGVDRSNDLAVVRLPDDIGPLPPPLAVDSAEKLTEIQKVYIFGFPLGAQLGKNITVSESSVSSLRRDKTGALSEVQVNGGMTHGNSGGPVTDARGVVIGVAVSGIRGTQLNFAIPGDLVLKVLDGSFSASELGAAYQSGDQVLLPVKLTCLDPLRRIRQLKLDVGTGTPGEGPRTTHDAVFRDGAYCLDVPLPSAKTGQACWLQPILVKVSGQSDRAKAIPVPADAQVVLERKPVLLQFKPPRAAVDRTLQLDSDVSISVYQSKNKTPFREKMNGKVLESLSPDQRGIGTFIRLTLADCPFTRESGDKKLQAPQPALAALKQFSPTFLVDAVNACKERGKRDFRVVAETYRDTVENMYETVCNTYEATTLPLPNRTVQPMETWPAQMPMFVLARGKRQLQDIFVTCTYEGVHTTPGGSEAHIALSGVVKGRGPRAGIALGKARGQAHFDVEKGFLTLVHLTVSSEVEIGESGVRVLVNDQSIVRRSEGNQLGIAAATRNQPGLPAKRPPSPMPIRKPPIRR
ncbi:MAG TPA: trypsin-like peptidase domain-containing protein [Gemmataceae bacterium]|nr:trypsin-like peptidase domain-containing protein [Gemmataceae bacterium]